MRHSYKHRYADTHTGADAEKDRDRNRDKNRCRSSTEILETKTQRPNRSNIDTPDQQKQRGREEVKAEVDADTVRDTKTWAQARDDCS